MTGKGRSRGGRRLQTAALRAGKAARRSEQTPPLSSTPRTLPRLPGRAYLLQPMAPSLVGDARHVLVAAVPIQDTGITFIQDRVRNKVQLDF